jgi:hypothetical protein
MCPFLWGDHQGGFNAEAHMSQLCCAVVSFLIARHLLLYPPRATACGR